jgi:hypothetical protein
MNPIDSSYLRQNPQELSKAFESELFFRPLFKSYLEGIREMRDQDEEDPHAREMLEDMQFESLADSIAESSPLGLDKYFEAELKTPPYMQ